MLIRLIVEAIIDRTLDNAFALENHTQPVAERADESDSTKLYRVCYNDEQTAAEVECVLIEYQELLLVLFRGDHGTEDKCVGYCSNNSDDHDCVLEIKTAIKPVI